MRKNISFLLFGLFVCAGIVFVLISHTGLSSAFTGPSGAAGSGTGSISVDGTGDVSVGTTTVTGTARLFVVGSSTNPNFFSFQALDQTGKVLFAVRNDGEVGVATTTFGTAQFVVNGEIQSASGGFVFPDGSLQGSAFSATSTSAGYVTPGTFNSVANTGGAYTFPATLVVSTTLAVGSPTQPTGGQVAFFKGYVGVGTSTAAGLFQVSTGTSPFAFQVNTSGNVGIGTSTPANPLTVVGNANVTGNLSVASATLSNFTAGSIPYFDSNHALQQNSTNFSWSNASTSLGIGTSTPSAGQVTIFGVGSATTSWKDNSSKSGGVLYLRDSGAAAFDGGQLLFGSSQGDFAGIKGSLENGTGPAGDLIFQTRNTSGNLVENMRVGFNGDVAIGTTSLNAQFTVAGGVIFANTKTCFALSADSAGDVNCQNSGTSGFVTKFSGVGIGNSLIQDNGTGVGVGEAPVAGNLFSVGGQAQVATLGVGEANVSGNVMSMNGQLRIDSGSVVLFTSGTSVFFNSTNQGIDLANDNTDFLGGSSQRFSATHSVNFYGTYNAGPDVAERYLSDDALQPGDLVAADPGHDGYWVKLAKPGDDNLLMGIVSTAPGVILSEPQTPTSSAENEYSDQGYPIALVGRVPVKVSTENGPIAVGDYLTLSSTQPGVAVKLIGSGKSVAMALGPYNEQGVGKILGFVGGPRDISPAPAATGTNVIGGVVQDIASILHSLGVSIVNGIINATQVIANIVTAHTVVTDGIQMKDQATGQIYCVTIVHGDFQKTPGACQ